MLLWTAALAAEPVASWTAHARVDAIDRDGVELTLTWTAHLDTEDGRLDCTAIDWSTGGPATCLDPSGVERPRPAFRWSPDDLMVQVTVGRVPAGQLTPLRGKDALVTARELGLAIASRDPATWSPEPLALDLKLPASATPAELLLYDPGDLARDAWVRPEEALDAWQCAAAETLDPPPLQGPGLGWWQRAAALCRPTPTLFRHLDEVCDLARTRGRLSTEDHRACGEQRPGAEWHLPEVPWLRPPRAAWPAREPATPDALVTCPARVHLDPAGRVLSADLDPACPEPFHGPVLQAMHKARAQPFIWHGVARAVQAPTVVVVRPRS